MEKNFIPSDLKIIYDEMIMAVDVNQQLDKVILSNENSEKINIFLTENKNKYELAKFNLKPINKLMFYGASGTGKTMLAKALANHLKYEMLYIDIAKALSENTVAKNISDIFKLANSLKNCIIFLDECDSIVWNRDTDNSDGGVIRRATNSIFQQLDQMDIENVFIAATNMLSRLDIAFERRIEMKMEFRRPNINIVEIMRKFIYPEFELVSTHDIDSYSIIERRVNQNTKLSYDELEKIAHRAMKNAVIAGTTKCKISDILKDISLTMNIKVNFKADKDNEEYFKSNII